MWRDFPRGLRVLLLDEDLCSSAETKLKLEAMDYIVFSYYNQKDALEAISTKDERFHVAIVEVVSGDSDRTFQFLEMAKGLPTVVISDDRCLSTMMKCIALGAAEFLEKPLSEDKLRNIWQHVVHKAFNAGSDVLSKSLKPIKETVVSMLQLQSETYELKTEFPSEAGDSEKIQENGNENGVTIETFLKTVTPQLIQRERLSEDGDGSEKKHNCLTEENAQNTKDLSVLRSLESKFSENTSNSSLADECSGVKEGSLPSSHKKNGDHVEYCEDNSRKKNSLNSTNSHQHDRKVNRKRVKVDWTPELHKQFVQAVEKLGIDQAIPSKILELMKVEGLTRHNIASHLQKFRMHRRHILPKDESRGWHNQTDNVQREHLQKPVMAFPPFSFNYGFVPSQVYPVWGHPNYFNSGFEMWGHAGFQPLHQPPGSWHWNTNPVIHADVWGCPIYHPYSKCLQSPIFVDGFDATRDTNMVLKDSYNFNPTEEVIDEAVKEAMSKPWLPMPLGLKPPSTEGVLAELHRQGFKTVPPPNSTRTSTHPCR